MFEPRQDIEQLRGTIANFRLRLNEKHSVLNKDYFEILVEVITKSKVPPKELIPLLTENNFSLLRDLLTSTNRYKISNLNRLYDYLGTETATLYSTTNIQGETVFHTELDIPIEVVESIYEEIGHDAFVALAVIQDHHSKETFLHKAIQSHRFGREVHPYFIFLLTRFASAELTRICKKEDKEQRTVLHLLTYLGNNSKGNYSVFFKDAEEKNQLSIFSKFTTDDLESLCEIKSAFNLMAKCFLYEAFIELLKNLSLKYRQKKLARWFSLGLFSDPNILPGSNEEVPVSASQCFPYYMFFEFYFSTELSDYVLDGYRKGNLSEYPLKKLLKSLSEYIKTNSLQENIIISKKIIAYCLDVKISLSERKSEEIQSLLRFVLQHFNSKEDERTEYLADFKKVIESILHPLVVDLSKELLEFESVQKIPELEEFLITRNPWFILHEKIVQRLKDNPKDKILNDYIKFINKASISNDDDKLADETSKSSDLFDLLISFQNSTEPNFYQSLDIETKRIVILCEKVHHDFFLKYVSEVMKPKYLSEDCDVMEKVQGVLLDGLINFGDDVELMKRKP